MPASLSSYHLFHVTLHYVYDLFPFSTLFDFWLSNFLFGLPFCVPTFAWNKWLPFPCTNMHLWCLCVFPIYEPHIIAAIRIKVTWSEPTSNGWNDLVQQLHTGALPDLLYNSPQLLICLFKITCGGGGNRAVKDINNLMQVNESLGLI